MNPDLTNKTESARSAAATTGVDKRNNVEQVYIGNPTPGQDRVSLIIHAMKKFLLITVFVRLDSSP